jgi:hypothetical protein
MHSVAAEAIEHVSCEYTPTCPAGLLLLSPNENYKKPGTNIIILHQASKQ